MPVTFTPIEAVIVKAINQDEFKDFSYQNADWRCLERGEVPKDERQRWPDAHYATIYRSI